MKRAMLVLFVSMFLGACGDSGVFSSDKKDEGALFDFSMVPSTYQKIATDKNIEDTAYLASAIQSLDSRIAKSEAMSELNNLKRLEGKDAKYESPYQDLSYELSRNLAKCTLDTTTDKFKGNVIVTYTFTPYDLDCQFEVSGSYRATSSTIGSAKKDIPTLKTETETFTLNSLPGYLGDVASVTYTFSSRDLNVPNSERGQQSRTEFHKTLTGKIVFLNGTEIPFGMKIAKGTTSVLVTDRSESNSTTDFRAGFRFADDVLLYNEYYQKLHGQSKATNFQTINGRLLNEQQ